MVLWFILIMRIITGVVRNCRDYHHDHHPVSRHPLHQHHQQHQHQLDSGLQQKHVRRHRIVVLLCRLFLTIVNLHTEIVRSNRQTAELLMPEIGLTRTPGGTSEDSWRSWRSSARIVASLFAKNSGLIGASEVEICSLPGLRSINRL